MVQFQTPPGQRSGGIKVTVVLSPVGAAVGSRGGPPPSPPKLGRDAWSLKRLAFWASAPRSLPSGRQPQRGCESSRVFLRGAPLCVHGARCVLGAWTPGRQVQRPAWLGEGQGKLGLWCVSAGSCVLGLGTPARNRVHCVVEPRCGEMVSPGSLLTRACPHTHTQAGVRACSCPPVRFP